MAEVEIPSTSPLLLPGKAETRMEIFVAKRQAEPIPWSSLSPMRISMDPEKLQATDAAPNIIIPAISTFLLPITSASFPKGTLKTAALIVYIVITHPTVTALVANSLSIPGIERFSALPVKVVRKDVTIAVNRVVF